ncbi:MAG: hypothetical protein JRF48_14335 [Deltaproteobacteria bacterium]|nr:hypothetical protein [Deltaproteobacteria bacterium]
MEQFTAGRVCSRIALGRLGVAATTPVLRGEDRAPIWPPGFVGTITHTDTWCAAAVARTRGARPRWLGSRTFDRSGSTWNPRHL